MLRWCWVSVTRFSVSLSTSSIDDCLERGDCPNSSVSSQPLGFPMLQQTSLVHVHCWVHTGCTASSGLSFLRCCVAQFTVTVSHPTDSLLVDVRHLTVSQSAETLFIPQQHVGWSPHFEAVLEHLRVWKVSNNKGAGEGNKNYGLENENPTVPAEDLRFEHLQAMAERLGFSDFKEGELKRLYATWRLRISWNFLKKWWA